MNKSPQYLDTEIHRRMISTCHSYFRDKQMIRLIENDCIYQGQSAYFTAGKGGGKSDPTATRAENMIKYTQTLRDRVEKIEKVLSFFNDTEQTLITQNLFEGIPIIYCNYEKSEKTARNIRKEFLIKMAFEFGEIY